MCDRFTTANNKDYCMCPDGNCGAETKCSGNRELCTECTLRGIETPLSE